LRPAFVGALEGSTVDWKWLGFVGPALVPAAP